MNSRMLLIVAIGFMALLCWGCDTTEEIEVSSQQTGPIISSVSPGKGEFGTVVTILGTNFSTKISDNKVWFNGTNAEITSATISSLRTTVPQGATDGKITIEVEGVRYESKNDFNIVRVEPISPTIESFNPVQGKAGIQIVIKGNHFANTIKGNSVKIGELSATITSATKRSITFVLPEGATTGKISVGVGENEVTSQQSFVVED